MMTSNTKFDCIRINFRKVSSAISICTKITSSGWPFVSIVLGQMVHLVSNSIRPKGFLSSVLLWLVIIVAVVVVDVTVVVVLESSFAAKL
ncbi:hypothetical protein Tco_0397192 [Tanacetum coccineum]